MDKVGETSATARARQEQGTPSAIGGGRERREKKRLVISLCILTIAVAFFCHKREWRLRHTNTLLDTTVDNASAAVNFSILVCAGLGCCLCLPCSSGHLSHASELPRSKLEPEGGTQKIFLLRLLADDDTLLSLAENEYHPPLQLIMTSTHPIHLMMNTTPPLQFMINTAPPR